MNEMDFTPRPSAAFSAALEQLLDATIKAKKEAERAAYVKGSVVMARPGIGAGRLGHDCLRKIAYEYHRTPVDPGREITGRLYRIFDRGHWGEESMAGYLRQAGFTLLTENRWGKQFRYDIAPYDDGKGRVKGMADGVITAGPGVLHGEAGEFPLRYPMLWENKELGNKSFNKIMKEGLRAYGGDYFPQVQLGMFHLKLTDNPALFTVKNADTQEVYAELVKADAAFIQAAIDKSVRVIATTDPEEMPRVNTKATDFRCKTCDFSQRCWATKAVTPAAPASTWSLGQ